MTAFRILTALALSAAPAVASAEPGTTRAEAVKGPSHPPEVALVDEGPKGSVYRQFPSGLRLYTSERDPPGTSACYRGCAGPWQPVYAPAKSVAVGDWQLLRRRDGKLQWMLKHKPVYTRFHDAPDTATGDGIEGVWHVVPYTPAAENPTARELTR
jgi:predicted lipoprotein with Yx(FWY)xxD motif